MAFPLILLLSISTTVVAASQRKGALDAQAADVERQADQERISAEGRELERRQRLNKVLAANVVGLVTSGISGEGTPAAISLSSARQASISEGLEGLSARLRDAQLKRQASSLRSSGNIQAASTLLKGGFQASQLT